MKTHSDYLPLSVVWAMVLGSLLLFSGSEAAAQRLRGKVKDAVSQEALPGAILSLKSDEHAVTSMTGLDGTYSFKNLVVGSYTLTVSYIGYQTASRSVEISSTLEGRQDFSLQPGNQDLEEIVVVGAENKGSDDYARKSELRAGNIVNIVSAKTIEVSPDITIGNVLQRVSGVSMVRNGSGDGQYAIIRGLPNRYTYTSLNGIILPSPDAQTRSIPLDMFPANMMERVEIIKSLTPNLEANAIGGAANLVMKDAPAVLTINGTLSTGGNTIFGDRDFSGFSRKNINFSSPSELYGNGYAAKPSDFSVDHLTFKKVALPLNLITNLSVGNRIFKNRLGYLIGGSYIREYRGSNTLLYTGRSVIANPDLSVTPNQVAYTAIQNREYSYLQSRFGLQGKLDYAFSPQHALRLYGLFLQLDDNQHRHMVQNGLSNGGETDYFERVIFTRKNIANLSMSGNHTFRGTLTADWTASYATAIFKRPDWTDFGVYQPSAQDTRLLVSNPLTRQWLHSKDEDKSGYANLKYVPFKDLELSVGGMYRSKVRDAFYNTYRINTVVPGLGNQEFTNINNVLFSFVPSQNAFADSTNPANYAATEQITAGYITGKITLASKIEVLGGVRAEITKQAYTSMIDKRLPNKYGSFSYTDLLPSLNLKYRITDKQNLRLSYFSGISRPNLYELVPVNIGGDLYPEIGNPRLKHTTSQNLDIRYENFFTTNDYLVAGVFYKNLVNAIEVSFDSTGSLQPNNPLNPVKDYGFELIFSKFFRNFGISGNYTYIQSSVTTRKSISQTDEYGNKRTNPFIDQTRPMQGQADHVANLSLIYKNAKAGITAQLSYLYTGKRISVVALEYKLDQWQRANSQLDFSFNKAFTTHFTLFLKATNLLNQPIYQDILIQNQAYQSGNPEQNNPNRLTVQKDVFKQSILAGVRFKF